jgi:hypothetical protein
LTNQYSGAPVQYGMPAPPPSRPATLAIAVWVSVLVGVLTIVGAAMMIVSGRDTIRAFVEKSVRDTLGSDVSSELIQSAVGAELDAAYGKLVTKAVVAIVVGVLVLLFALIARNAGTVGRIGLTVVLVAGMCAGAGLQLGEADVLPTLSFVIAAVTPMLSLVAIVLMFVPPTTRYAKARKGS